MKQYLKLIVTLLLVHIAWSGIHLCANDTADIAHARVDNTLYTEADILTSIPEKPVSQVFAFSMDQTTTPGLHSMGRHLRTAFNRNQLIARENILLVKALIGHLSRYQSLLTMCANRTFTSFGLRHWNVPADCYVFGIRHIII